MCALDHVRVLPLISSARNRRASVLEYLCVSIMCIREEREESMSGEEGREEK